MYKKSKSFMLTILWLVLATSISVHSQAKTSKTDVFIFDPPPGGGGLPAGFVVGSARLDRSKQGLNLTISTTSLEAGDAYTVWWIIFNNPSDCVDGCGSDDFPIPGVRASVMNATGGIAETDGTASFSAFLPAGYMHTNPSSGNGRQLFGPGLQNVAGAEIHVVIRSHGPWMGDIEQISTVAGSCTAINVCFDPQAAVFPLPKKSKKSKK